VSSKEKICPGGTFAPLIFWVARRTLWAREGIEPAYEVADRPNTAVSRAALYGIGVAVGLGIAVAVGTGVFVGGAVGVAGTEVAIADGRPADGPFGSRPRGGMGVALGGLGSLDWETPDVEEAETESAAPEGAEPETAGADALAMNADSLAGVEVAPQAATRAAAPPRIAPIAARRVRRDGGRCPESGGGVDGVGFGMFSLDRFAPPGTVPSCRTDYGPGAPASRAPVARPFYTIPTIAGIRAELTVCARSGT
jgi:hypothetical protein